MAADAAVAARDAEDHVAAGHQRRAGPDLGDRIVRRVVLPEELAGGRVEGGGLTVERVEEELAVRVGEAPRLRPAAGAHGGQLQVLQVGAELPLDEPVAPEVERVHPVRLRRHDVHRVAHDERRRLVRVQDREREGPRHRQIAHVVHGDPIQRAVVPRRVVAVGHDPLGGVRLQGDQVRVLRARRRHADPDEQQECQRGGRLAARRRTLPVPDAACVDCHRSPPATGPRQSWPDGSAPGPSRPCRNPRPYGADSRLPR